MQLELIAHRYFIVVKKVDITPDDQFFTFSKLLVVVGRIIPSIILYLIYAPPHLEGILFFTACFLLHLLIFPIQLNVYMGKPLHYLGRGFFDRILGLNPSFMFRVWILLVLSVGAVSAYYNTDLL